MIKKYLGDRRFWGITGRLALPIAFQNLLMSSFALVDRLMVSSLGDVSLAAVGMAGQVNWLMSMLLFGFCSGSSIFISQYWGIKDTKTIYKVFGLLFSFTLGISAVFFCIARFSPTVILNLFSDNAEVTAEGVKYLVIACFAYPATAVTQSFSTLLRSTENVKLPMYVTLFATILNAVLNYGLIFGKFGLPELGVRGA
ncbi:MAG: MATE family efflux transporter, partial [Clostridiales bacterium]|nr:MATE family efflux transporter [Clostridiales bacterium]